MYKCVSGFRVIYPQACLKSTTRVGYEVHLLLACKKIFFLHVNMLCLSFVKRSFTWKNCLFRVLPNIPVHHFSIPATSRVYYKNFQGKSSPTINGKQSTKPSSYI
uniref:Uncharacterized protein n=1 Tax=Opuntia streptacantha TaxID=393608 RepID=A0A7C8YMM5_OPUST